jgi:hypothetical protein
MFLIFDVAHPHFGHFRVGFCHASKYEHGSDPENQGSDGRDNGESTYAQQERDQATVKD